MELFVPFVASVAVNVGSLLALVLLRGRWHRIAARIAQKRIQSERRATFIAGELRGWERGVKLREQLGSSPLVETRPPPLPPTESDWSDDALRTELFDRRVTRLWRYRQP